MNKVSLYDTIITPIITENSSNLPSHNKAATKVRDDANKKTLKKNIEKIFKVNVVKVNIINKKSIIKFTRGRNSRVKGFKKAIITLKKGQSIDLTTGI